jgi:glycosyltransferase involved in cell wall biosynthesis
MRLERLEPIMTRALIIEPAANLWGSERALLDLIHYLPNVEVAVCCPPEGPLISELEMRSIRLLPYFIYALHEKTRWQRLWAAMGVLRACLEFRPDVIYLNQSGCYRVVLPAAVLLNMPIIGHIRLFEDVAYLARRHPNPRRLRGIIAISSAILKEIRHFPQLKDIKAHHLYDAYLPSTEPIPQASERITNRLACVGRVAPNKGQDVLIEAIGCLKSKGNNIECFIIGDGESEFVERLKQLAAHVDAASEIRWLGTRSDIIPILRTCVVLVCPSHREALGRVIFEAWDAGVVPIVCSKSGGAAEIVGAADAGVVYEEQEPQALAVAIAGALQLSCDEIGQIVENGRSWLSKNCDVKRYGEAIAKILSGACLTQAHRT